MLYIFSLQPTYSYPQLINQKIDIIKVCGNTKLIKTIFSLKLIFFANNHKLIAIMDILEVNTSVMFFSDIWIFAAY